jgi:hypothetical protein
LKSLLQSYRQALLFTNVTIHQFRGKSTGKKNQDLNLKLIAIMKVNNSVMKEHKQINIHDIKINQYKTENGNDDKGNESRRRR